jgi:hypothetical protein
LASKRPYSAGVDWKDVAGNLVAFEAINGVRLEIRISTGDYKGRADLLVTAIAHETKHEIGEAPPLASVSATCSGSRLRSLEALVIHILYTLDGRLADNEMLFPEAK